MGSRMVVTGIGNGLFKPDQQITRAEFVKILARGLGLKPESGSSPFSDVSSSDWYNEAVQTAYAYSLISGYGDGTFHPQDIITREQSMAIIAKAMKMTDLRAKLPRREAAVLLSPYADAASASGWAISGIADSLHAGIVTGRTSTMLAPKALFPERKLRFSCRD
ncbi:S-layer homology domain-containing protein [Cohnella silvisoli]|uniref:S-layer homology domain-containing protein n=1 Tax=Cohnella silvisoli TaxID=2873699 RepID=A0ABV1KPS1_9BACL|nr:S-layer homology domain-containing protein [Cohnella silvisoli]MCD9025550.1 S-layer homology domain-containing protein [Cohnella silvisoli]